MVVHAIVRHKRWCFQLFPIIYFRIQQSLRLINPALPVGQQPIRPAQRVGGFIEQRPALIVDHPAMEVHGDPAAQIRDFIEADHGGLSSRCARANSCQAR